VVFTSESRRHKEIDARIGKANAVLGELNCSVVKKTGTFKRHKVVSFLINLCSDPHHVHESWIMNERMLSQMQATEIVFLRVVHGVTLRDKVRGCEIPKALNVLSLLRIKKSQLCWFGHVTRTP